MLSEVQSVRSGGHCSRNGARAGLVKTALEICTPKQKLLAAALQRPPFRPCAAAEPVQKVGVLWDRPVIVAGRSG